ncbi:MAG TPA: hypothetical protein VGE73_03980 [Pseudolabrys sp.]|jgi:hypothetical protein
MIKSWSSWKRFPNGASGESIEAPIGPGVYEVRRTDNGALVAFGHSANVANAISELKVENRRAGWVSLLKRRLGNVPEVPPTNNLEYRTYAASSRAEAKTAARRFVGLRQAYWRQRTVADWVNGRA